MSTRVVVDDDEQQIADMLRQVRRLRSRLASVTPRGGHDTFTAAATPATTYQLSVIPILGTCLMALNGHVQREGTDYSVAYDTGLVTVSASQASGDKVVFRYLITDWLVARSLPPDTAAPMLSLIQQATPTRAAGATSLAITFPAAVSAGSLVVVTYWDASASADVRSLNGLSATWTDGSSGQGGMRYAIVPGGGSTITLSDPFARTWAMMAYEFAVAPAASTLTFRVNGNTGIPTITTDTIAISQSVLDLWWIKGNTTAPTTYDDRLPALAWHQLTQANDATDVIQFAGAYPTATAAGSAGIAPTTPTSGVTLSYWWQFVLS